MNDWCPENDGAYRAEMAAIEQSSLERKVRALAAERDAAVARAEAAEAKLAGWVKVKPLVWREANDGNHKKGEVYSTRSPFNFAPIAAHKKNDGWWLNMDSKTYPTLEAAKAAAQSDHERRILAALEGQDD